MHRTLSSRWLRGALSIGDRAAATELPGYLCPALNLPAQRGSVHNLVPRSETFPFRPQRCIHVEAGTRDSGEAAGLPPGEVTATRRLPLQCHGCGAFSQTSEPNQPGYYDTTRKAVWRYMGLDQENSQAQDKTSDEDFVVNQALQNLDEDRLAAIGLNPKTLHHGEELDPNSSGFSPSPQQKTPLCNRCHSLVHHHAGTPIYHPTVDALSETIEESPYKYNHIYHVIDAADFPMSFIPKLHQQLGDVTLRRRNRRSRAGRYYKDRKFDMSFIITRSDLLAPTEQQVNSLMPYLRGVLRDALGEYGNVVRLGNLKCVSARRSWWTKDLKQEIYKRGGAGWMVGKVNVGKSELFEAVFPKGTTADLPTPKGPVEVSMFAREENARYLSDESSPAAENESERLELDSLLPPARAEVNYPDMPTVSSLPGTTASPIRIPFGNGKGELIDLPGLPRGDLELFVQPEHRNSLIMQDRIKPEQHSIKPGKSLVIGGLIRITPRTPGMVFLGYNFTTLKEHLTATDKAAAFQDQTRAADAVQNVCTPESASEMRLAGSFPLRHDVTKARAGPITRKDAINIKVENLPYRVLSTDILIEGVGWVEITAQVRARELFAPLKNTVGMAESGTTTAEEARAPQPVEETKFDPFEAMEKTAMEAKNPRKKQRGTKEIQADSSTEPEPNWPLIDVYSPLGKFVGARAPLNGWMLNKPRILPKHKRSRPRKSMKGAKKRMKQTRRDTAAQAREADAA